MKAVEAHFLDLLGSNLTQFIIPVYQRVYSWEEREARDLWEDVIRAGKQEKEHFIGSFLYTPQEDATATSLKRKLLIDGQQRMTTLSLMLSAFIEWLEEDVSRGSFLKDVKVSSLRKRYLYNDDDYVGDSRYRLVLSQDDKATLFSIVSNKPLPVEPSPRIVNCYQFFRSKVRAKSFDPLALWSGVSNLLIIDTELSAERDNAQLIFESMNSKGKPLTPIDLIRNYILMRLPADAQATLYESYWRPIEVIFGRERVGEFNAFVWYWLWLKVPNRHPKENEAYDEFKRYCQDEGLEDDPEGLLTELRSFAERYSKLFMGLEPDQELRSAFNRLEQLGVKSVRPLMLSLYALYDDHRLNKPAFLDLCLYLESFLFRRAVIGRFTTGLNNYFAGMYRNLETAEDPREYVLVTLLAHDSHMTGYFPTDDDFSEALKSRDLYNRFSKGRYCLEQLEKHHNPKEPLPASLQIEHIMPQSIEGSMEWKGMLGQTWEQDHLELCDTLGNLTLTGYNQEYSNSPFETKLNLPDHGFKSSSLFLNKSVASCESWNRSTIEKRADLLAADALEIWPYPNISPDTVGKYRTSSKGAKGDGWTIEEDHPLLAKGGICEALFNEVREAIQEAHPDWEMYTKKYYVGFRTGKKLHMVVEGRSTKGGWLGIGLARTLDELDDPEGLCTERTFGPGLPTRADITDSGQIPALLKLCAQC